MGIYIGGMKMPVGEDEGLLIAVYDGKAYHVGTRRIYNAIEIQKHGRLIDADALIKRIPTNFISIYCVERILEKINTAPTIIPAEEG